MREVDKTTNHQKTLEQVLRTFIPLLSRNSNTIHKLCVLLNTNTVTVFKAASHILFHKILRDTKFKLKLKMLTKALGNVCT